MAKTGKWTTVHPTYIVTMVAKSSNRRKML